MIKYIRFEKADNINSEDAEVSDNTDSEDAEESDQKALFHDVDSELDSADEMGKANTINSGMLWPNK